MHTVHMLRRSAVAKNILRTGLCIGLAGGMAEIVVVWVYAATTGGNGAMVARHVAAAVGLAGASAAIGVAIHLALSLAMGVVLAGMMRPLARWTVRDGVVFALMPGCLAIVWAINFFVVLPVISPSFVHLLPFAISLTSKLAFGLAAAATWVTLARATGATGMQLALGRPQSAIASMAR